MLIVKQSLGIDVGAKELVVCLKMKKQNGQTIIKGLKKFANTPKGINALEKWLAKRINSTIGLDVVMEATGVYFEHIAYHLHELDYQVHVLLPNRIKYYIKFLNVKSKTDRLEAKAMAQLGLDHGLSLWQPASDQMYKLKRLSRERTSLLEEKTVISNRLHAEKNCRYPDKSALKRYRQRLNLTNKQIKSIENQLMETAQKDEQLMKKVENISKVKGLGIISILTIIAETNGFQLFKNRAQLVSYAGYDVVERQSGISVKGKTRISKKGNSHIRRTLHFPALVAVRFEQEFKLLYERIFDRTKIKMKAYVAVQRKLLVLIYTLYKKDIAYDPNYYKTI